MKGFTKKALIALIIISLTSVLTLPILAAPIDKIFSDQKFMAAFDPDNAVVLPYSDGEKPAVAIPSNAHYADYADVGFWFIWDSMQKDSGYAVLSDEFFAGNESLILTVKSSNEYRNVTITKPGTYFIDRFLLKNEKKGPDGGYHNINWIGFQIVEKYLEMEFDYAFNHGLILLQPGLTVTQIPASGYLTNIGTHHSFAEITLSGIAILADYTDPWALMAITLTGNPVPTEINSPVVQLPNDLVNLNWTSSPTKGTDNSFLVYDQATAEAYLDYYESVPAPYRKHLPPPIMYGKIPVIPGLNERERVFAFYPGSGDYLIYDSGNIVIDRFDSFKVDLGFSVDMDLNGPRMGNDWQGADLYLFYHANYVKNTNLGDIKGAFGLNEILLSNMIFAWDSVGGNPAYTIQGFLESFYYK